MILILMKSVFPSATEGKILVEDIVKLGSQTEEGETTEAGKP